MRYSSSLPFFFEDPGESFEENHLSERNSYRTATLIHTYIHTLHTYIHTYITTAAKAHAERFVLSRRTGLPRTAGQ